MTNIMPTNMTSTISTNVASTVSINSNDKKVTYKTNYYILNRFLLMIAFFKFMIFHFCIASAPLSLLFAIIT